MSTTSPLVSATGIWYGYFPEQTQRTVGAEESIFLHAVIAGQVRVQSVV